MIYTSYFGNLRRIPKEVVQISICAKSPPFYNGLSYKKLSPSYSILSEYKMCHNKDLYTSRFKREILYKLDVKQIVDELYTMSNKKDIVLLCYERPQDFCHRILVSEWFKSNGFECLEYKNKE